MNNRFLVSLILGALPLTMMAQDDDMYFVPSKKSVPSTTVRTVRPAPTFHSGSERSVDEYNRRGGSYYQVVPTDTTGTDIINFDGELGVYPDSAMTDDFALTREMSRWDGYESDAYLEGYRDGRRESAYNTWHSPWFYSSYYPWYDSYWYWNNPWYGYYGWYDPWYYGWYDPWYYGYGYYRPWYGGYWHGYYPPYHGGGIVVSHNGPTGTQNHGRINYGGTRGLSNGRSTAYSSGSFGGRALEGRGRGTFGGSRSSSTGTRSYGTSSARPASSATSGRFGGNGALRSSSSSSSRTYTPSMPSSSSSSSSFGSSSSSSSSGGSFGGGGSSYGGSRSSGGGGGGGGRFGGRR